MDADFCHSKCPGCTATDSITYADQTVSTTIDTATVCAAAGTVTAVVAPTTISTISNIAVENGVYVNGLHSVVQE